jgi:CDP-diacylglycerol--glycerol-3-phosphate 3-phosphatidyltransferase
MIDGRRKKRPGPAETAEPPAGIESGAGQLLVAHDRAPGPEPRAEQSRPQTAAGQPRPQTAAGQPRPQTPADAKEGGGIRLNLGSRLVRMGVKADHVTIVGLLVAALTGAMVALGYLYVAVAVGTAGCLMDTLDGAVAKAAGSSSKRGAFFDSVTDRVADAFIFGGLAWYFAAGPGKDPGLALLPFGILAVSNVISYERAKAESLGWVAKGGLMERAERLILLGVALLLHIVLVPLLWLLFALCVFTAFQRFFKVWRQATAETAAGSSRLLGWRPARVESRWREWRATSSESRRPRMAPQARLRARRRDEPLSTRVRRMITPEAAGSGHAPRSGRSGRERRAHARDGAGAALRRRLGSGR